MTTSEKLALWTIGGLTGAMLFSAFVAFMGAILS
jgi:hypothetical protein